MLNLSGLWGMMATGLVLLWSSGAIAQSLELPNERPTVSATAPSRASGTPTAGAGAITGVSPPKVPSPSVANTSATTVPPQGSSTVAVSLICDSSGKICITPGKQRTATAPVSAPAVRRAASSAAASPSAPSTPEFQPPKQQSLAAAPQLLICDATGQICAPTSTPPARGSISGRSELPPGTPMASTMKASPLMTPPVAQPSRGVSVKASASKPPVKELGALDHATRIQLDGIGADDYSASLVSEDPFDWVVHAYKSQHRLEVYFKGHLYKTYHAVFGRSLAAGAKLWEGDRRTPEGNYLIVGKHRSARFGWFLHINYPNEEDRERFEQSRAAHVIPASANEGGQIGIHGTDSPYLNVADVNWTTGCISVDNGDIGQLARLLPVGTLVIINP